MVFFKTRAKHDEDGVERRWYSLYCVKHKSKEQPVVSEEQAYQMAKDGSTEQTNQERQ